MTKAEREESATLIGEAQGMAERLGQIGDRLREMADAEQEKYDNLTEGLQASERGTAFESNANNLGETADAIQECADSLENISFDPE